MNYYINLLMRVLLCFLPGSFFYFIFFPLTVYSIYFIFNSYAPKIIGETIFINNYAFTFIEACIAPYAYKLFFILSLLTREIKLWARLKIIFFGFLLIFLMNVLRICILILINFQNYKLFETLHFFWWQVISGVYIALIWILLVRRYNIKDIPVVSDFKFLLKKFKKIY